MFTILKIFCSILVGLFGVAENTKKLDKAITDRKNKKKKEEKD